MFFMFYMFYMFLKQANFDMENGFQKIYRTETGEGTYW